MNVVPIAFSFDNNMLKPACVCLYSLLRNAAENTFYDIYILHSESEEIDKDSINVLLKYFSNCNIQYRTVRGYFDGSFEIRGITVATYYRLLIPDIIPEYDKIIYSDVDVIFRSDLSDIYNATDVSDVYFSGVNSLFHLMKETRDYYEKRIGIPAKGVIYAGNMIINSKKIRDDGLIPVFIKMAENEYKYQDLDIINISCLGKIGYMPPSFCLSTYIAEMALKRREELTFWSDAELQDALANGIVHYNGQKPWIGYCLHFDIWWEYYRMSPYFEPQFYFDFFKERMDEYDTLPLFKRIKILARYFYARK